MNFGENLQNLRKRENLSQENLAEKLNVSRQAVSKWESDSSYPEMDKLISISEIFNVDIDALIKGEIPVTDNVVEDGVLYDKNTYDKFFNKVSLLISFGVFSIIFILGILAMFSVKISSPTNHLIGLSMDNVSGIIFFIVLASSVAMFIYSGMSIDRFKKEYPKVYKNMYSKEEISKFESKKIKFIISGVSLIFLGVIILILFSDIIKGELLEGIFGGVFLMIVAVSVFMFVYTGMMDSKYSYGFHKEEDPKASKISGVIMLSATFIFLFCGFIFNLWYIAWVVFPLGGILCGIIETILKKD